MSESIRQTAQARHLERLDEVRPQMAKAVKKIETPWREQMGKAVERCFALAGLSDKEAAGLIGKDPGQVGRWISGEERPQFDTIFAAESLRQPLVQALSELAGADVEVTVRLRRRA